MFHVLLETVCLGLFGLTAALFALLIASHVPHDAMHNTDASDPTRTKPPPTAE